MFPIERIQKAMAEERTDGWLLYDFQGLDPVARRVLRIAPEKHLTRRWFYFIPKRGVPVKLVHRIEPAALDHLPGEKHLYAGWRELEKGLRGMTAGIGTVAMNYSPLNAIPYVSRVDAGTVEWVRSAGLEVVTAADMVQRVEAVWSEEQLQTHVRAAKVLRSLVDEAFDFAARNVGSASLNEYDLHRFLEEGFLRNGLLPEPDLIVAAGPNSGNPHYGPTPEIHRPVREGDFLLLDIWGTEVGPESVYADITWTGYLGKEVPETYASVFRIVRDARDAGLHFVREAMRTGRCIRGAEVDDVVRGHVVSEGYGDYFLHRTGHNIGRELHGNGANIDNFETREERRLIPGTCFSIEPGIYLKEFGVRSEIDVYLTDNDAVVYGLPMQTDVVAILR